MSLVVSDIQFKFTAMWLGVVARLEECLIGMQAAPSSIPTSGTLSTGKLPRRLAQEQCG